MTEASAPVDDQHPHSAWAVGYAAFVFILLLLVAAFHRIAGLGAEEQAPRGQADLVRQGGG